MEFWGVEVKAGEPLKVEPKDDCILHLSQAALGESKKDKGNELVPLFVKFDNKKIALGTLSAEKFPQLSFDLVFEKEFELSHNWKSGSVYFCGYQSPMPDETEDYLDSEDEEGLPLTNANNVFPGRVDNSKPKANVAIKPSAKPEVPGKDNKSEDESDQDDESDEDESEEDESGEEDESEEGMSVDKDSDDDEDEETPKKAEPGKKRLNDSAMKTPQSLKKAKSDTPQKTDGKKGGHTATPHPAKNAGKAAANGNKSQTPKSGGQFSCNSCSKSFGSDGALQAHSKAKHGGK